MVRKSSSCTRSLSQKCEILRAISIAQPKSDRLKEVRKITKKVEELVRQRNIVAHGIIVNHEGVKMIRSLTLPKVLLATRKHNYVRIDELPKIAFDTNATTAQLLMLVEAIEVSTEPASTALAHKEHLKAGLGMN